MSRDQHCGTQFILPSRFAHPSFALGTRRLVPYRRISGRKNWNSYLLRYGRSVAYASWWEQDAAHQRQLEQRAARLDRTRWGQFRRETKVAQSEQRKRFRFRNIRQAYLASLEERWVATATTHLLP